MKCFSSLDFLPNQLKKLKMNKPFLVLKPHKSRWNIRIGPLGYRSVILLFNACVTLDIYLCVTWFYHLWSDSISLMDFCKDYICQLITKTQNITWHVIFPQSVSVLLVLYYMLNKWFLKYIWVLESIISLLFSQSSTKWLLISLKHLVPFHVSPY